MKPFRVWGTKLAALALLLVMATNALALPLHPIDDDPNSPPNPPVYVGDPDTGYGGRVRSIDPGLLFGSVLQVQIMMLTHVPISLRTMSLSRSVRGRRVEVRRHD